MGCSVGIAGGSAGGDFTGIRFVLDEGLELVGFLCCLWRSLFGLVSRLCFLDENLRRC